MRRSSLLIMILIGVVAVLAGWLAERFSWNGDWSAGQRNSLTTPSLRVLDALDDGPIEFTAYIYPGAQRADVRQRLARYTRAADRIRLRFADPARHPDKARQLGLGPDGAVVVSYRQRQQVVTDYAESSVTQALQRLSPGGERWIVFVTGHGERAPDSQATAGYRTLVDALAGQGLKARPVNLARAGAIPDNTDVLVIASPQSDLLPGEVAMIRRYVQNGGAILWADDPGARYGLESLSDELGMTWQDGTLVYPDFRKLGTGHPAMAVVGTYPDTPVTNHLDQITLFPYAGALSANAPTDWQSQAILRSPSRSWLETGSLDRGSITFEPGQGDRRGPLTFGIIETRAHSDNAAPDSNAEQRAVIIADSDFMDNGHIGRLGNRALALSLFQWLAGRDNQIAVDVPKAPDARLRMDPADLALFWWLFVLGLPGALFGLGLARWWWRRRR